MKFSQDELTVANTQKVVYEPGNGTRYTVFACQLDGNVELQHLGSVRGGWLIISGNYGTAHLFQPHGYLHDGYVKEKLRIAFDSDVHPIAEMIRKITGRPGDA